MSRGYGSKTALPVWVNVMKAAVEQGYPAEALSSGPERGEVEVCRVSGDTATSNCQHAGQAANELIPVDLMDGRVLCTYHDGQRSWNQSERPHYTGPQPMQPVTKPRRQRGVMDRIFGWLR